MTALLEQVFAQVRQLPEDKQNTAAEAFLKALTELEREEPVTAKPGRKAGSSKGMIWMAPDYDEPLADFKDYM